MLPCQSQDSSYGCGAALRAPLRISTIDIEVEIVTMTKSHAAVLKLTLIVFIILHVFVNDVHEDSRPFQNSA
jgi:hypothetical protein